MLAFIGLCINLMCTQVATPPAPVQLDAVVTALGKGDAKAVSAYFDKTVELVLPGVEDIVSKEQAQGHLTRFFTDNPTQSFARVHGGKSNGEEGAYVIGTLTTSTGKFRVFVYGRGAASPIVQELRVEVE